MKQYIEGQEKKCRDIDPFLRAKMLPAKLIVKNYIEGETSCNYEIYIREIINESSYFRNKAGGEVYVAPVSEDNKEPDAISEKYTVDFKLLVSRTRMEAKRELSPSIFKLAEGIIGEGPSRRQGEQLGTNICRVIRYLKNEDFYDLLNKKSKNFIEKDICIYLKSLRVKKNIIYFLPLVFSYDQEYSEHDAIEGIQKALYRDLCESMKYREENAVGYDTYVATIYEDRMLFFKLAVSCICYIDSVQLDRSYTYMKIANCGSL